MNRRQRHCSRRDVSRQPIPRYVQRLIAAFDAGLFAPDATYFVEVAHDDWCPKLAGGLCCCTPEIRPRRIE